MPESGFEFAKNADEYNQHINRHFYDLVYFDDIEYGNDDNSADEDYWHTQREEGARLADKIQADEDYWLGQRIDAYQTNESYFENSLEHIDEVRKFILRASNHFHDTFGDAFEELWQMMLPLDCEEIDRLEREETEHLENIEALLSYWETLQESFPIRKYNKRFRVRH